MNTTTPSRIEALNQRPIKPPARCKHQEQWILGEYTDATFRLVAVKAIAGQAIEIQDQTEPLSYEHFWPALSAMDLPGKKWWMIGFRTTEALRKASFFEALEQGAVKLCPAKKGAKKQDRSGKFTLSDRTIEIDLVAGKNRVKLIDWRNFGVHPQGADQGGHLAEETDHAATLWNYLSTCHESGMTVNRPTAAQIGWSRMRRGGLSRALWANPDASARELERRSYHSGRCEPYYLGSVPGTAYLFDVRACYAAICENKKLPVRMIAEYPNGIDAMELLLDEQHHWIADVEIVTPTPDYPMRDQEGKVFYPTGQFLTTLAWPELLHAIRANRVVRITRAAEYEAAAVLRPYAEWCMRARARIKAGPMPAMENILKATFNASLGFTARKSHEWIETANVCGRAWAQGLMRSPEDDKPVTVVVLNDVATWLKITGEPREAIPYLHATITSWARVELLRLIETAGRENTLYVDTDGIMVTEAGAERLIHLVNTIDPQPGDLVYGPPPGRAHINGQKNYRIGDHLVCAGLKVEHHQAWTARARLETETGKVQRDGTVQPWESSIRQEANETGKWVNELH